ncbi:chromosomal replication initiator DnaA [Allosphingosinicella flava]|uniref:Chromosomal replication initiator DnaA n=1 Tax=Allosphingosinicella flava TaxID=2771430 RepID=A0A7T2GKR1_9SPHN|nr:DnaA/Hda family protein [Sphingosinicella flava]QPQ55663.1 chromosomal replication initiator DnaA [Sphingosinicella flava]
MGQIALPLNWPVASGEEDFLLSDANRLAFEHLRRWHTWPVMATILVGPRKSGRSLLGGIFARKVGGRLFDDAPAHDEETLFHAWNDAQAQRRPVLLVSDTPHWEVRLPDLRSRLAATPHVEIGQPDDGLICNLIVKLLSDRGIVIPPEIPQYVAPRIERSYMAVLKAVDILDRTALSSSRRLTLPAARSALSAERVIDRHG